jgi:deoxycytidylate deaminase
MKISNKVHGYLALAKRVATQSEHDHFKHGAVLVRGGSVINTACNKDQYKRFGNRFRNTRTCGHATYHAELGCVLGLDKSTTQGATLYVVRTNRAGTFRMSKPCQMCEEVLRFCGIKRVVYTTGNGIMRHRL